MINGAEMISKLDFDHCGTNDYGDTRLSDASL